MRQIKSSKKLYILPRLVGGAVLGILIGDFVNICISLGEGNGTYYAAMPHLIAFCGNEIRAVLLQALLTAFVGAVLSVATVVFSFDDLGFPLQCLLHFAFSSIFYVPFVWLCWMPGNLFGVCMTLLNLVFTYCLTWCIQYITTRRTVIELNARIAARDEKQKSMGGEKV